MHIERRFIGEKQWLPVTESYGLNCLTLSGMCGSHEAVVKALGNGDTLRTSAAEWRATPEQGEAS